MECSITHFKSVWDNQTKNVTRLENFLKFEQALYALSEVEKKDKLSATLISPAVYKEGTTRSNANVIKWSSWCAVDVDEYIPEGDLKDDLLKRFANYYFVCYSTASSRVGRPKFRLIFPLTSEVGCSEIPKFWHALNNELGELADRQTKDLSRMYYVPGRYNNSFNFIFSNCNGTFINPVDLMAKHPFVEPKGTSFFDRLPKEIQDQIVEHRKSKAQSKDIQWTGYADCPLVNKELVSEYMSISGTGWYHTMYRIMVSIAANAIRREYPITPAEIATLCKDLDAQTGNWYDNRPLEKEAERAIEFVYRSI
tara:strand:+ start:472 stop:1401 length:930 start_codon:yes stop_codon:yes gene_type:complete